MKYILCLLLTFLLVRPVQAEYGDVYFSPDEITSNGSAEATAAIADLITTAWEAYLYQDTATYTDLLASDTVRLSQRVDAVQQGREAVIAGLATEWETFERPDGLIAAEMTIHNAEFIFDGETVTTIYWIEVVGGARWEFTDQGLIVQVFVPTASSWQIAYQMDTWNLNYDLESDQPGAATFDFAYVYPADDLAQAVEFYTPLLGEPEAITADQAFFNLKGSRFILDSSGDVAEIKPGLPNGYAIFYVPDLAAEQARLLEEGVSFIDDITTNDQGDDTLVGVDAAGNLFMLMQRHYLAEDQTPPTVSGFTSDNPYVLAAEEIAWAWAEQDTDTLAAYYGDTSRWFDETRTKVRGIEVGQAAILTALEEVYWSGYDQGDDGLSVDLAASQVSVYPFHNLTLVSYHITLTGTGNHPFRETAFVTHLFNSPDQVLGTFIMSDSSTDAMVVELDYTGYPVENLAAAEAFYTDILGLGEPYSDEGWRGYWSNLNVFGIYEADPATDGLPQPETTNGYVSFWVYSAQDVYDYLVEQEAEFPIIPAINEISGLDAQPGYVQVYTTDSEGNGLIFTEYTGRRR